MLKNKDFLVLLIRLFLGYVFFSAGICKLTHGNFGQLIGPPWLEQSLAKYGLGLFAQVVACCQVLCGALLFTQRFSTLGAVMLVPMNVSILAVTVSQNWTGTPYVNTVFLLLNLLLLGYEYQRFRFLFSAEAVAPAIPSRVEPLRIGRLPWAILGAALVTMVLAPFQYQLTNISGLITFGLAGAILLTSALLSRLEKVLVAQAIVNMFLMTLGFVFPFAPMLVAANCGVILLVLLFYIWRNGRKKERTPQLTSAAA
ncbi:DoxX family membrane protein [Rufibacter hautae]|uniref:DoxX family membrane protein n=1 Tax=Rufibacter hautae TaxID=2595005 RepID=A0A5B6TMC4_9BACT|nr:DoxX family membrane protein [Rufibacter hautae]KAA3440517.1 DoxX family membrane protein [Rufibacter hautae]